MIARTSCAKANVLPGSSTKTMMDKIKIKIETTPPPIEGIASFATIETVLWINLIPAQNTAHNLTSQKGGIYPLFICNRITASAPELRAEVLSLTVPATEVIHIVTQI